MKDNFTLIILSIIISTNILFSQQVVESKSDSTASQEVLEDSLATSSDFRKWQASAGYSVNNNGILNFVGSYLISLDSYLNLSLNLRLYDIVSFSTTLNTKKIGIYKDIGISLGAGVGISDLPLALIGWITFSTELSLKIYFLDTNFGKLFFEASQVYSPILGTASGTEITYKPVRFLSLGVEF